MVSTLALLSVAALLLLLPWAAGRWARPPDARDIGERRPLVPYEEL